VRKGGPPPPPRSGGRVINGAHTLSPADFVRSYPEEWLQHRQALEKIML
jgi:hypothetical protein